MSPLGEYPPLLLPPAQPGAKRRRGGGPPALHRPGRQRQTARLGPKFSALEQALEAQALSIGGDVVDQDPELVLVFEVSTSLARFAAAVGNVEGLELLLDIGEIEGDPDDDFHLSKHPDRPVPETLYLLATNRKALDQLLGLWGRYQRGEEFVRGFTPFRDLFDNLREMRRWDVQDRLAETGLLEDWRTRLDEQQDLLPVELELWYRDVEGQRAAAQERVMEALRREGGAFSTAAQIPEIRYHAVLARVPAQVAESLLEDQQDVALVRLQEVMLLRPVGQAATPVPNVTQPVAAPPTSAPSEELDEPLVAILDGLPLATHTALDGWLDIDDPQDVAASSQVNERRHGTAIAGLVVHGDLSEPEEPLLRRVHVRPVILPDPDAPDFVSPREECVPPDVLVVDLLHRAVRRLFEGEGPVLATAPSVRVLNISLGDLTQAFHHRLSAWARLLDWLAVRYRVLFVVSAGNELGPLTLGCTRDEFEHLGPEGREDETLRALRRDRRLRRVLAPAEAINVVSVGAVATDSSTPLSGDPRLDPTLSPDVPAPYSRTGPGFRRAIKPEILLPGGRRRYGARPGAPDDPTILDPSDQPRRPPGQLCASPVAATPGRRDGALFSSGTSYATALATRAAARLWSLLDELSADSPPAWLTDEIKPVLVKALLVHGADWGDGLAALRRALPQPDHHRQRLVAEQMLGYGRFDIERLLGGSAQRITLLGGGLLAVDEGASHTIPLPPSLHATTARRRITYTLACFSSANSGDQRYRRARVWVTPMVGALRVDRQHADHNAVQRGTVQHEVLEGESAPTIADGDTVQLDVSCAADAGVVEEPVPYGLAVTLEVAPNLLTRVYPEVAERVRPRVRAATS